MNYATPRRRSLALCAAMTFLLPGCLANEPSGDDGDDPVVIASQPVRCAPAIDRYPIAAPHNGGYDRAWSNFTCAPHPAGSPDNSDYGGDHHGNDLFAPRGAPVVAVRDGRVTRSGVASSISGNRVTIEDDCGWSYYFGHLTTIAAGITPGARVRAGQVIGTVGNTGATGTAPHVHFNVHRDGNYSNDVDPFPLLQAADRTACDPTAGPTPPQTCAPRCEGSTIVGRDCGRGDCGAYGANCVDDNLGPRCVFFACRPQGDHRACWLDRYIGHCRNGALLSQGDCGAYGASCVDDALGPRCVFFACRPRGEHGTCWGGRYIGSCRDGALVSQGDCGAYGANCVDDALGARCVFFACRPTGEHDVCFLGTRLGHCRDGALVTQSDCATTGDTCVADDLGGRCVSPSCPSARGDVSFCVLGTRIARCSNGVPTADTTDCAARGQRCVNETSTTARCVPIDDPTPSVDAGPPRPVDGGPQPEAGMPLPDVIEPTPVDAALPPADVLAGADVPPAADVPLPDDVEPFFVPDAGPMAAEVKGFEPPMFDDGEDPCAVCRPLGRCPPQCDDAGASPHPTSPDDAIVRPGCSCTAGATPAPTRALALCAAALSLALTRRRRRASLRRS